MKKAVKSVARKVLSSKLLIPKKARVIFVWHDVSEKSSEGHSPHYSTSPKVFREQIKFLSETFDLVSLKTLHDAKGNGRPMASLTFDDGFLSVLERAHPVLKSLRIPYTVFLNKRAAQENFLPYSDRYPGLKKHWAERIYLNEEEIRQMSEDEVLFGSHTVSHVTLSEVDAKTSRTEIQQNKEWLDHLLLQETKAFAFPYGKSNHFLPRDVEICREVGHTHLYSNIPGFFLPGEIKPGHDLVPRVALVNETPESIIFSLNVAHIRRII